MDFLQPWMLPYLNILVYVLGISSVLDALVPKAGPDTPAWLRIPRAALHLAGQNYGKARRALQGSDA